VVSLNQDRTVPVTDPPAEGSTVNGAIVFLILALLVIGLGFAFDVFALGLAVGIGLLIAGVITRRRRRL